MRFQLGSFGKSAKGHALGHAFGTGGHRRARLKRLCGRRGRRLGQGHRAAGLFDRGDGGLAGASHMQVDLGGNFALGQQPNAIPPTGTKPGGTQGRHINRRGRVQPASVDGALHIANVDRRELLAENIGETAFGQTPINRHLPAFEAINGHTRTRLLPLLAMRRRFPHA